MTGSGCTANGNCLSGGNGDRQVYEKLASGASTFTLKLRMKVRDKEWVPRVEWVESCPFNKADGVLKGTECSEPGGTKTGVMEGKPWSITQACWAYRDKYVTQSADNGTCQKYVDNPACTLASRQCAFYSDEGICLHEYATYSCESRTSGKVMVCGGDVFCLDGECDKAQSGKSSDFGEAVSQLAALAAAGKDVAALNGVDVRAFTGEAKFCRKAAAGFSNCCKDGGWGQDVGLAKCNSEEKALGKAKDNKLTVSVGEFCSKKVLGVCLQKKRSYCQFDSKLAQIVQQQGRNGQLRISFGSAKHPDCRGITVDELQKIQFDRLDFTNFYEDLMNNQKIPDSGVLTQKVAVFVLISLLVNVRTSVQIIDNSDLVKVHRVDNVPVGLAMPLSLTTRIGHAMVASYEMIFTQPDSVTYSKTGMLFGAELVSKSTDFLSRNPEIANLFQDYVQNCVMGDIYLNHKYTLEELMASSDPYTLIFSRPSPLRGVYDSNNNFVTCKDASVSLKDKLNLDTQSGGKTWHYYAQQLFGGRPDPNLLFSTLIGDSYSYFYGSSKSASQIIRQNVTINALKEGITSYAARNGDSASLVNLATTSSMEKQRLAHVSIGHVAMRTLPMTQTILTGIAIGIFPLLVLAAVFNKLTLSVLKGYVFALMWLQSWPMLYAILNSAMTFYAKQNGAPVVLSEISQIQLKYSDLASTAGYLSMMIPPLSWMMVRGLGAGFSSVYSHFASSAISPTASAAGSVVDGNYSYGNMQTENVNGFSWSTNSTTSFGQMMYQTGSGATATQTRDGNMVMDASGAMSRLPVGINATRQIAAAQQEMAREASNRAESALHGFSSSIASAWNTLSQFGSNRGSSDSVTGGADSTMSAQDSMMASRMRSAVESYAKAHNISNEQATQELASRSTRASAGMYGDAHAEWGVKPKILGVGGGLGVKGGGRAGIDWEDNDAHTASSNTQSSHNARHDIDARATQDFKEASDYFTSRKVSESGSHTDNNADSRVDQLSAALNSAKQSYDQFTTNMTRSHEYAEMASRTESMSGQMSEDLSQQFAQYVMKHAPQDAEAILTNTSSPEIAERRRAMAWSFVQEQVQPGVDNAWRESRGDIGKGMESVPSGGGSQDIIADHQGHQAIIEQRTQDSNIRNDVKHQVDNMVTEYKGNIGDTQNSIRGEENIVRGQYSELQNHHKTEALSQDNKYNEEKSAQERMPGADSPQELMKRAKEYQDKYKQ
ncbi:type-F conjugative transfer system mating-pair stabilization protein TraN [Escherichia coli]|nr:type-F conjugative transfer system mating-pair stabilization protein TraN [Escherichia coli]